MTAVDTMVRLTAHPYADAFPLLPDVIEELVESIAANGQRSPVVLTTSGLILDGRHRAAACEKLGIAPETVTYEGDDLAEYVIDCNSTRRNLTTGQRAAAVALVLAGDGRRQNGRWAYGSLSEMHESVQSRSFAVRLNECGVVLDYAPELLPLVVDGSYALSAAFGDADDLRRSQDADEIAKREAAKREREEAKRKAERDEQILAELTRVDSKYLPLIADGTMTPAAAWSAHREDTAKERKRQEELEHGWRTTTVGLAERVRMLQGGKEQAAIYLKGFHPHADKYVVEPLRLTEESLTSAIEFLTAVREGITE